MAMLDESIIVHVVVDGMGKEHGAAEWIRTLLGKWRWSALNIVSTMIAMLNRSSGLIGWVVMMVGGRWSQLCHQLWRRVGGGKSEFMVGGGVVFVALLSLFFVLPMLRVER